MSIAQGIFDLNKTVLDRLAYITNEKRVEYMIVRSVLLVGEALLEVKQELQDIKNLIEENK